MKTLYLFRHGDTEEDKSDSDYSRKLTGEGRQRTAEMAENLKSEGSGINLIITSGALRAKSTAGIIAEILGYPVKHIVTEDILYSSVKREEILPLICGTSADISSLMVVGHNPLLSDFSSYICRCSPAVSMGKSSVVKIEFDAEEWSLVKPGSGKIIFYRTFMNGKIVDDADKLL